MLFLFATMKQLLTWKRLNRIKFHIIQLQLVNVIIIKLGDYRWVDRCKNTRKKSKEEESCKRIEAMWILFFPPSVAGCCWDVLEINGRPRAVSFGASSMIITVDEWFLFLLVSCSVFRKQRAARQQKEMKHTIEQKGKKQTNKCNKHCCWIMLCCNTLLRL